VLAVMTSAEAAAATSFFHASTNSKSRPSLLPKCA
jgi:hypothetical protein